MQELCPATCAARRANIGLSQLSSDHDSNSVLATAPIEPTRGVSNVVFTLVRSDDRVVDLLAERSACLSRALFGGPAFDHVIFHDGTLTLDAKAQIGEVVPGARFFNVYDYDGFTVPANVVLPENGDTTWIEGSLGYRHMVCARHASPRPPACVPSQDR